MSNVIRIKRSAVTAAPATLQDGELAYSHASGTLFIGNGSNVYGIGGKADHDKLAGIADGAQVNTVDSVNGETGAVVITKSTISLGNVQNVDTTNASNITSGTLNIARLPAAAIERLVPVVNTAARYALTTAEVQVGDTVKETATGLLYFVVDDTKLDQADGYVEYTAGTASSVDWSGVLNVPAAISDLGVITGAIAGDVLSFDGTNWTNIPLDTNAIAGFTDDVNALIVATPLENLSNVSLTAIGNNHLLRWNSTISSWENVDPGETIPGTTGQFLRYSGDGFWEGQTVVIDDLDDVVINTPATGEVLMFDGTDWINGAIDGGSF